MTEKNLMAPETLAPAFAQISSSRRSVRGFLSDPVPHSLLEEIFTLALNAPSNCNSQPWFTHVVSGKARDAMSERLLATIGNGEQDLDFAENGPYRGVYRERQIEVAVLLYESLGIRREDKQRRHEAFLSNLKFFGAPHAAFIFMPDWAGVREAADVGLYAQNLMLAMQAHGLGSCPQTLLGFHASVVREQLGLDDSMKLLFGISFGYADDSQPQNQIRAPRVSLAEQTYFHK